MILLAQKIKLSQIYCRKLRNAQLAWFEFSLSSKGIEYVFEEKSFIAKSMESEERRIDYRKPPSIVRYRDA